MGMLKQPTHSLFCGGGVFLLVVPYGRTGLEFLIFKSLNPYINNSFA